MSPHGRLFAQAETIETCPRIPSELRSMDATLHLSKGLAMNLASFQGKVNR
jgi:hypothetical protein